MTPMYAALQMAALAVAARACMQLGHRNRWSAFVPSFVTVAPTTSNGTKRPTRRLEKRLT